MPKIRAELLTEISIKHYLDLQLVLPFLPEISILFYICRILGYFWNVLLFCIFIITERAQSDSTADTAETESAACFQRVCKSDKSAPTADPRERDNNGDTAKITGVSPSIHRSTYL